MTDPLGHDSLTKGAVQALLRTQRLGRALQLLKETTSTNMEAVCLAQLGIEHGTVVVAEHQTAGKGRLGRSWHSPAGGNLYCSVILRATMPPEQAPKGLPWIPLASAVAAARAVKTVTGLQPAVKWPNDLLVGHRKLGGLLCESGVAGRQNLYVVVGIGINVNTPREAFPVDLQDAATSLVTELSHPVDRAALLAAFLFELEGRVNPLLAGLTVKSSDLLHEYSSLCSTLGRKVRVSLADGATVEGVAHSIAVNGSLCIVESDGKAGKLVEVHAGDVIHLR